MQQATRNDATNILVSSAACSQDKRNYFPALKSKARSLNPIFAGLKWVRAASCKTLSKGLTHYQRLRLSPPASSDFTSDTNVPPSLGYLLGKYIHNITIKFSAVIIRQNRLPSSFNPMIYRSDFHSAQILIEYRSSRCGKRVFQYTN